MSVRSGIRRTLWIVLASRCGFISFDELDYLQETRRRELASILDHAWRHFDPRRTDAERSIHGDWIFPLSNSAGGNHCSVRPGFTTPGSSDFKAFPGIGSDFGNSLADFD